MPTKKSSNAKAKPKNLRPKKVSNDQAASVKGGAVDAFIWFDTPGASASPAGEAPKAPAPRKR
jgi:hypothetical protein